VGILVYRGGKLLLIERRKPPFGFAPPAGHVDGRNSFEEAAAAELFEEVGLKATELRLVAEGRKNNPCRRPNGSWHFWKIYQASTVGKLRSGTKEVKSITWCSHENLLDLANRTKEYTLGDVSEESWTKMPGLEPVWLEWAEDLGLLSGNPVNIDEQWNAGV